MITDRDVFMLILFIAFAVAAAAALVWLIRFLVIRNRDRKAEQRTVPARCIAKGQNLMYSAEPMGTDPVPRQGVRTGVSTKYKVSFLLEDDGTTVDFKVSDLEFETFQEGDYGRLTYKGSRFLGFVKIRE